MPSCAKLPFREGTDVLISVAVAALWLGSHASAIRRCEVVSDAEVRTVIADSTVARNVIAAASWIVRAKAVARDSAARFGGVVAGGVSFDVLEVLKAPNDASLKSFTVFGHVASRDDFNRQPVPYRTVRPSGLGGGCFAHEYRLGAQYLFLLTGSPNDGSLEPDWAPLLPTNEQINGDDDPWLRWVRARRTLKEGPRD